MKRKAERVLSCLLGGIFAVAAAAPPAMAAPRLPRFSLFHRHRDNRFAAWNDGDRALLNRIEDQTRAAVVASRASSYPDDADYGVYFDRHPDSPLAADFRRAFGGGVEMSNNCYSFAVGSPRGHSRFDKPTPGAASGILFDVMRAADGAYVRRLAERDGLRPLAEDAPAPEGFYRVALFVAPGHEFHWYREGPGGVWYHKRGHLAVTDRDASGRIIRDPRRADRNYPHAWSDGSDVDYTEFVGFFAVPDGGIDLDTPASHDPHREERPEDLKWLEKLLTTSQSVWRPQAP